jgi:hypothetical protein
VPLSKLYPPRRTTDRTIDTMIDMTGMNEAIEDMIVQPEDTTRLAPSDLALNATIAESKATCLEAARTLARNSAGISQSLGDVTSVERKGIGRVIARLLPLSATIAKSLGIWHETALPRGLLPVLLVAPVRERRALVVDAAVVLKDTRDLVERGYPTFHLLFWILMSKSSAISDKSLPYHWNHTNSKMVLPSANLVVYSFGFSCSSMS